MNCRKCGANQITRQGAGRFACQHCGPAPQPVALDPHSTAYPVPKFTLSHQEIDDGHRK